MIVPWDFASGAHWSGPVRAAVDGCQLGWQQHLPNPADSTIALAAAEVLTVVAALKSRGHGCQLPTRPAWNIACAFLALCSQKARFPLWYQRSCSAPSRPPSNIAAAKLRLPRLTNKGLIQRFPGGVAQLAIRPRATWTTSRPTRAESASRAGKPEETMSSTAERTYF